MKKSKRLLFTHVIGTSFRSASVPCSKGVFNVTESPGNCSIEWSSPGANGISVHSSSSSLEDSLFQMWLYLGECQSLLAERQEELRPYMEDLLKVPFVVFEAVVLVEVPYRNYFTELRDLLKSAPKIQTDSGPAPVLLDFLCDSTARISTKGVMHNRLPRNVQRSYSRWLSYLKTHVPEIFRSRIVSEKHSIVQDSAVRNWRSQSFE